MDEAMQNGENRRTKMFVCPEERRLTNIENTLNGKDGVQTRMARIEEKVDTLIKGKINWLAILSIFTSIAMLIVMIIALRVGIPS